MAATRKTPKTRPSPARTPTRTAPSGAASLRARFFPTTPRVTAQIQEWARSTGARVRAIIPVYTEDSKE